MSLIPIEICLERYFVILSIVLTIVSLMFKGERGFSQYNEHKEHSYGSEEKESILMAQNF